MESTIMIGQAAILTMTVITFAVISCQALLSTLKKEERIDI